MTTIRSISKIEADLKAAAAKRAKFRSTINEGQGGYVDETEIERLAEELSAARKASSPLTLDLAGERAWFNSQGFRCPSTANAACLKRGYSLAELQAACKAAQ